MADVDLIVPTIDGREASLERCLASFGDDVNPIVIRNAPNCGTGWKRGIAKSRADYLLLCADDIECDGPGWLDACVDTVDAGYIPAPVIHRPDGSLESAGGDMQAPGCLIAEIQADWTPVDFTPLPFVGRSQIQAIGMINAHYKTDTYLSHKGRYFGWETVLRHDYRLIHHHAMHGRLTPSANDDAAYAEGMR